MDFVWRNKSVHQIPSTATNAQYSKNSLSGRPHTHTNNWHICENHIQSSWRKSNNMLTRLYKLFTFVIWLDNEMRHCGNCFVSNRFKRRYCFHMPMSNIINAKFCLLLGMYRVLPPNWHSNHNEQTTTTTIHEIGNISFAYVGWQNVTILISTNITKTFVTVHLHCFFSGF